MNAASNDERSRHERIAKNEIAFRRVNEALEPRDAGPDEVVRFVCECGRLGCTETVALTRSAYEAVRRDADRFALLPGHEIEGAEVIVEDHGDYLVVAKVGLAGHLAAQHAPRGREPSR